MGDKWSDTSDDTLWSWSPLRNPEIYQKVENKGENHDEENLESPDFVSIITQVSSSKPEKEEKYSDKNNNTLSKKYNPECSLRSYK